MPSLEIREMPFQERYDKTLDFMALFESFVPAFVRYRLDDEAEIELRRRWREGREPVSEDASAEVRYESAYRNFISMARTNFAFVHERLDEDGMSAFFNAEVEALKRHNVGLAPVMLSLNRALSQPTAFKMVA
ncbi:MAG: hypothetical protein PVH65_15975 [Chloroflexota bacterium]|jgi:hypothetical protein